MTVSRMSEQDKKLVRILYGGHRARKNEINAQIKQLRAEKVYLNKCTSQAALAVKFEEPIGYIKRIVGECEYIPPELTAE